MTLIQIITASSPFPSTSRSLRLFNFLIIDTFWLLVTCWVEYNDIQLLMNHYQQNKQPERRKNIYSHLPKGSFHSYCRRKLHEQQVQFSARVNATKQNSRSFQTYRSIQFKKPSLLQRASTFEQYLSGLEKPGQKLTPRPRTDLHNRNSRDSKQNQNSINKVQNQQIVDSHLPFFKCKLQKTEFQTKRPDFRVKENKFKFNRNVVENNCLLFLAQSLPLREF